jgi:hypothetical protein
VDSKDTAAALNKLLQGLSKLAFSVPKAGDANK